METCRYCGGSGSHAPDCPTRPAKEGSRQDDRESGVPGFTVREAHSIVAVVDHRGPEYPAELLDKVTPENLDALIADEVRRMVKKRGEVNARDYAGLDPDELVEEMYKRNSSSHAIQCSVNRVEDYGAIIDRVNRFAADKGVPDGDADLATLRDFYGRQERMLDLSTDLFRLDIARRIGDKKGDDAFFSRAAERFPALADDLLSSLDAFETANKAAVDGNEEMRDQLDTLRARIERGKTQGPDDLSADFYGDIVSAYARIVYYDEEVLNERKVRDAASRLSGKEPRPSAEDGS